MNDLDTTIENVYARYCEEKDRLDCIEKTEDAKKAIKLALIITGIYNLMIIIYRNSYRFNWWDFEAYYKWLETNDPLIIAAKRRQQKAEETWNRRHS